MNSSQRPYVPLVALALAVVAVGVVVTSVLVQGGAKPQPLPASGSGPALVSQAQLERLAAVTDHPVFWAGPKKGYSYELTRTSGGRIYIRYLPQGVKAGDPRSGFLVVGTYAQPGSFAYLKRASRHADAVTLDLAGGGIALYNSARPTSVYFTFPGARYQVEVYDPSAEAARSLVLAGTIAPLT